MHPFLRYAREKQPEIIALIQRMVECESPSDSSAGVNRLVDLIAEQTHSFASAETMEAAPYGRLLRLQFKLGSRTGEGQILGLGHSDTVWPLGTLDAMPWNDRDGRLWGPGVLDMKAGLAFFIYAVKSLMELGVPASRPVALLIVSDEEVGSPASRPVTEAEARKSSAVLVLEPGTGLTGKLKTARKGVGRYTVDIHGRASHAGVDFAAGASAILEAAQQIRKLAAFTDLDRGTTVNPGVISGGTRSNVIAAHARIEVDVRLARLQDALEMDQKLRSLEPVDKRCSVTVEGGLNRPPMERTELISNLFRKAQVVGRELGVEEIEESATGGGSDGNFTAALGIPTLDGLGAVGEGAHAPTESILIDRIADRTALLAGLLAGL
jgi:glutamate carboxypeptidase